VSQVTKRRWIAALVVVATLVAADHLQAPQRQITARVLVGAIDLYQAFASPAISKAGVRCRFEPSCSRYSEQAILKYGALPGVARTAIRLARCGPWTPQGTIDHP